MSADDASTPPRPLSQRELQRIETRRRVYDAALAIFRRDGVQECRIEDIARLANVSRGTFYFHFPTKDAVLLEVLAEAEAAFVEAVDALQPDATVDEVVAATARAFATSWQQDPELFVEVGVVALRRTADSLHRREDAYGIREVLAGRFTRAAERGEIIAAIPAQSLADFFLASFFAVAMGWTRNRPDMTLEAALQGAGSLFLHGARAPA
ncbi:MAG: TetR/AcrR family transcriptional regulator [Deltaproteobacteria bacterium]|nr:MAG: TetR/AcrR family transcriptional regulator [Deltaproteobacteria bacterium]